MATGSSFLERQTLIDVPMTDDPTSKLRRDMPTAIVVPEVRPGDDPLTVIGWLVDEGDFVIAGDLVVELSIPGVTFDVTSNATGRLVEIVKSVDSRIAAGDILGWIDDVHAQDAGFEPDDDVE